MAERFFSPLAEDPDRDGLAVDRELSVVAATRCRPRAGYRRHLDLAGHHRRKRCGNGDNQCAGEEVTVSDNLNRVASIEGNG